MAGLAEKKKAVEELKERLHAAGFTFVADYRGLSVAEMTELRRALRKENVRVQVAKNTLMRRAVADSEYEGLAEYFSGPTAVVFSETDPVAPVKIIKEFLKKAKKKNELRGGFMEGRVLTPAEVEELGNLPSIDELRGKLVGALAWPGNQLVAALSSPHRQLANVLDQYAKTKEGSE